MSQPISDERLAKVIDWITGDVGGNDLCRSWIEDIRGLVMRMQMAERECRVLKEIAKQVKSAVYVMDHDLEIQPRSAIHHCFKDILAELEKA